MKLILIGVFTFLAYHNTAYASQSCDEMWGSGTTNASACVAVREKEQSDKLIEEKLQLITDKFTSIGMDLWVEKLRSSQKAWVEYRSEQCRLEEFVFGGIGHVSTARCEKRMSSERVKLLEVLL